MAVATIASLPLQSRSTRPELMKKAQQSGLNRFPAICQNPPKCCYSQHSHNRYFFISQAPVPGEEARKKNIQPFSANLLTSNLAIFYLLFNRY
jgi:hypothetical protein